MRAWIEKDNWKLITEGKSDKTKIYTDKGFYDDEPSSLVEITLPDPPPKPLEFEGYWCDEKTGLGYPCQNTYQCAKTNVNCHKVTLVVKPND